MTQIVMDGVEKATVANPDDVKEIKTKLQEMVDSLTRVAAERDLVAENKKFLKTKYGLNPKQATRLAKAMYNGDFEAVVAENEEFAALYQRFVA